MLPGIERLDQRAAVTEPGRRQVVRTAVVQLHLIRSDASVGPRAIGSSVRSGSASRDKTAAKLSAGELPGDACR